MTPLVDPPVAIAVVSWNTRALLDRCLRSLQPEAEAGRAEVWVVDNASDDGSPELVRETFPWARLTASRENLGFGRAVNLVAAETRTPWLVAANADVEPRPGALAALLKAGAAEPGAGALAPRLVLPDGRTQHSVYAFPTLPFALAHGLGLADAVPALGDRLCAPGRWDPDRGRRVDWAVGAFLLLRREAWEAAGGFDPAQWMYAEDLDLGWRLARAGWHTRYVPEAAVRHDEGAATDRAWGADRADRWMLSTYAWMLRRRGAARTRAYAAISAAGAAARWALAWPAARARPERFGARSRELRGWAARHARAGLGPAARLRRHR